MKLRKILLSVSIGLGLVSASMAQINIPPVHDDLLTDLDGYSGFGDVYTVEGQINTVPATQGLLSADFRIDFIGADTDNISTIVVTVVNSSAADSLLAAFYLTKPLEDKTIEAGFVLSDPNDWTVDPNNSLDTQFNNEVNTDFGLSSNAEKDAFRNSYFGAYAGTRLPDGTFDLSGSWANPVENGEVGQFWFEFGENTFTLAQWESSFSDKPMFFTRWQNVNYVDNDFIFSGDSGKGYYEPVIPEPSEVALMAMLGLGGLLYGRKRLLERADKRA